MYYRMESHEDDQTFGSCEGTKVHCIISKGILKAAAYSETGKILRRAIYLSMPAGLSIGSFASNKRVHTARLYSISGARMRTCSLQTFLGPVHQVKIDLQGTDPARSSTAFRDDCYRQQLRQVLFLLQLSFVMKTLLNQNQRYCQYACTNTVHIKPQRSRSAACRRQQPAVNLLATGECPKHIRDIAC